MVLDGSIDIPNILFGEVQSKLMRWEATVENDEARREVDHCEMLKNYGNVELIGGGYLSVRL